METIVDFVCSYHPSIFANARLSFEGNAGGVASMKLDHDEMAWLGGLLESYMEVSRVSNNND